MKRQALPQFVVSIAMAAIFAIISSAFASAQTRHKVQLEATVPFEFIVGNRNFPAGKYVFEMATGSPRSSDQSGVLVVRNHEHKLYAAVATDVTADGNEHMGHKLVFVRNGDRILLAKVWRQGSAAGLSVHTAPGATQEQEWQESQLLTVDALAVKEGL